MIQLRGASDTAFAHDITIRGLTVAHSAPTYMADYEMPSGGDWSIHRGGAVFLDGTEDITIEDVHVDQAGKIRQTDRYYRQHSHTHILSLAPALHGFNFFC